MAHKIFSLRRGLFENKGPAVECRASRSINNNQLLTNAPPVALHLASDIIAKPWPLQAFRPLQEFAPPLQALWPLQALATMHLPSAAYAVVDTVDTAEPARNRVAAAAASVAPDLESNFMTISSRIVDTKNAMPSFHRTARRKVWMHFQIAREPGFFEIHPELGTGIERFGYSGFKRKFLFLNLDIPSMRNTGPQRVFPCARQRKPSFERTGPEIQTLQRIRPAARWAHERGRCCTATTFIGISSTPRATVSVSPSA
jgi:hypothetical protein